MVGLVRRQAAALHEGRGHQVVGEGRIALVEALLQGAFAELDHLREIARRLGAEFLLGGLVEIGLAFVLRTGRNGERADPQGKQSQRQDRGERPQAIQACHAGILHGERVIERYYIPLQGRNRGQNEIGLRNRQTYRRSKGEARVEGVPTVKCRPSPAQATAPRVPAYLLLRRPGFGSVAARDRRSRPAGNRPRKTDAWPAGPDRFRPAPPVVFLIRGSASLFNGELLTTWTARCQASAGVVCGNSWVNSRTRSRLVCPPLRQRLRRIVRVPVDIIPQRLRKISLPGPSVSAAAPRPDARGIDLLQRTFAGRVVAGQDHFVRPPPRQEEPFAQRPG